MPLQMSIWLLMNLPFVSSLKAVAALPSHTETSAREVLYMRYKEKFGFFLAAEYLLLDLYGSCSGLMMLTSSLCSFYLQIQQSHSCLGLAKRIYGETVSWAGIWHSHMDESNELPLIQNGLWTLKGLQNKSKLLVDLSETVDGKALCMFTVAISGGGCGQVKKYCSFRNTLKWSAPFWKLPIVYSVLYSMYF